MSPVNARLRPASTTALVPPDDVPARAGLVDETAMQHRLGWLFRGCEADARAERLRSWVLDYWRERQ